MSINPNVPAAQRRLNGDNYSTLSAEAFFYELKHIIEVHSEPFYFHQQINKGPTLFVGEGNLSFSLCFAADKRIRAAFITATTYENADGLTDETRKNASILRAKGAAVRHGVDATRLERNFSLSDFSTIIFNFPNAGSRDPEHGHNPNHMLVRNFLISAKNVLSKDGLILISSVDTPHWRGAFQFPLAAEKSGFQEPDVYRFYPSRFPGYAHINTHDNDSAISEHDKFCTWVFRNE